MLKIAASAAYGVLLAMTKHMISIFSRGVWNDNGTIRRVSARIRGEEISKYLGANYNIALKNENDTNIFIKSAALRHVRDGDYIDILDEPKMVKWLKYHPKVKVIAMSQIHYEFLEKELDNEIILIPHHHVNLDRVRRTKSKITKFGYIGPNKPHHIKTCHNVKEALDKVGLNFEPLLEFEVRQDIINYYETIDVQIIGHFNYYNTPYRHPTKIINAMSFGIPTIAEPIMGYKEIEGFYIPVFNMRQLVKEAVKLTNLKEYNKWPEKIIKEAEKYHISNIANLYRKL